ncbi:helicase-exonuclease AddAB subunit AddB [Listeria monocytogenes]|uniref:helicase-exonuclease AddAB subunit AddB n=1 Tax=Listeria monocytogenes TaxID=1639 RepID=UPI0040553A6E
MTLQIIAGRSGTGKTTHLMDGVGEKIKQNSKTYIFIVPDQMTFQMETSFLNKENLAGMLGTQIFSFSRLAWKILQETGGLSKTFLSQTGIEMVIRKAALDQKDKLKIFSRATSRKGFYSELANLFKEMKQEEVSIEDMVKSATNLSTSVNNKVHDISLIYQKYEELLADKFLENEDYLRLLAEKIADSDYLNQTEIVIDGFTSFSKQELTVIGELMRKCDKVTISLTLNVPEIQHGLDEYSMFKASTEAYYALLELAKLNGTQVEENKFFLENKRAKTESLAFLANTWGHNKFMSFKNEPQNLKIHQANNRRAEIEGIAREIRQLALNGYRYRDIAILTRNLGDYDVLCETVMEAYNIPTFIDKKRAMAKHPFIEFIRSSLDAILFNWKYEPIFQAVKTEFFFDITEKSSLNRRKADILENYVLENGIQNKWKKEGDWIYRKIRGLSTNVLPQTDEEIHMQSIINEMRNLIVNPLSTLELNLRKAKTGMEFALALYHYLEQVNAVERLESWRQRAEEQGYLELAREHEQAWSSISALLDEFVEVLGEETLDLDSFTEIIGTGLDALEFSLLPPSLDQVVLSDMENAKLLDMKVIFAIGMNDGVMPLRQKDKGIFSDQDRDALRAEDSKLKPSAKNNIGEEDLLAYKIISLPSDKLFLSYPAADEEGKVLSESNYLRKIKGQFNELNESVYLTDPSLLSDAEQSSYIRSKQATLGLLTSQLQMYKRGYTLSSVWWDAYNSYFENEKESIMAKQVLSSLYYENKTKPLQETTAKNLFGETIHASVSRMEKFFSCEFQHYAQYGLKLEERGHFQLQAVDMGEIFHGAMEWISAELKRNNLDWGNLTEEECKQMAKLAMTFLAPKIQHEILLSSKRMEYIQYKLLQIITRATTVLNEQAKSSAFRPVGLEVDFGLKGDIPPLKIPLQSDSELLLQGRIDRIDMAEQDDRTFLRIIDYKSSSHDLALTEVYYGLALQMLTYLDIVVTNAQKMIGKTAEPAGVLYFHMHNQYVQAEKELSDEAIAKELQKSSKMKGLILSDPVAVSLMDMTLEKGKASTIIPAEIKQNGELSARSRTATRAEFDKMRQFVRHKYQEAGNKILDGAVSINPYKLKERTPCQFCSFRSFCGFDPSLTSNQYRHLANEKAETILTKMDIEGGTQ